MLTETGERCSTKLGIELRGELVCPTREGTRCDVGSIDGGVRGAAEGVRAGLDGLVVLV